MAGSDQLSLPKQRIEVAGRVVVHGSRVHFRDHQKCCRRRLLGRHLDDIRYCRYERMRHVRWNDDGFHVTETPSKTGLTFSCPLVGHFDDEDTLCLVACLTLQTLLNVECGCWNRPYGLTAGFEMMVQAVAPASRFQSLSGDSNGLLGRPNLRKLHLDPL